jgi:hypothetical protein
MAVAAGFSLPLQYFSTRSTSKQQAVFRMPDGITVAALQSCAELLLDRISAHYCRGFRSSGQGFD